MLRRIGLLTGGGDCPGLNPALKWVVNTALDAELAEKRGYRFEVIGIRDGWRGLVRYDPRWPVLPPMTDFVGDHFARVLVEEEVRTWDRQGGTRLGSSRTNPFKTGKETWPQVLESVNALDLHALIAIGGEDTLGVAYKLSEKGVRMVCIPKTIDRDLQGTDYSLGFETAVNVIVEEIDRLRTTARSHGRTFIVETMGRHAGHLALSGGIAAGASVILIPEVPFRVSRVVELLKERRAAGYRYSIVVVAEGAREEKGSLVGKGPVASDGFDQMLLGGIGRVLEAKIEEETGWEVRCIILSHLQRGGVPCAFDRTMGRWFGVAAMDLVAREQFNRMVVFKDGAVSSIPIPAKLQQVRVVDVASRYDVDRCCAKYSVLE